MSRRPAGLVPPPVARLVGYALLAGIGSLQWVRYVEGASAARVLAWVAAGVLSGALVLLAARLPGRRAVAGLAAAAVAGLAVAIAASGLDLVYLQPARWDELGDGLARGGAALNTVRLPYLGREPWVLTTVQLTGAGLCWAAAVLACWPRGRGGPRTAALALLLVLAAAPIVSIGAQRPVLLGLALAALTAAFLWLERLSKRPGLGLAVLGAAALLTAVPLGAAADREEPWFDYKAFSERIGGGAAVTFDWDQDYGPIDWPREGVELFRVRSRTPYYWKAETLDFFDGRQWTSSPRAGVTGDVPADDLPSGDRPRPEWDARFTVALRRLKTSQVVGAGTILDVTGATQPVEPAAVPGQWQTSGTRDLARGDSYEVRAHVPRPSPAQLAAATVGRDARRHSSLLLRVGVRPGAVASVPAAPFPGRLPVGLDAADIRFAPYESGRKPVAEYVRAGISGPGAPALRNSGYDRSWALSQRLRRAATSPYDYVVRVNNHLRGADFAYTEVPPPFRGEAPLESFLVDTQRGYCQQFSGGMVLLLRMGGIPARVATGFSPGGLRTSSGEWVVRDTDAHAWVEAWFDGLGWVTFDPTPPQTPARSQVAAIAPPAADDPDTSGFRNAPEEAPASQRPERTRRGPVAASGGRDPGGSAAPGPWVALGAAFLVALAAAALAARARRFDGTPEGALEELRRALRRSGRFAPAGTTLSQLERALGVSGSGYLRAHRAERNGPQAPPPSRKQRAAFRRELATGLGRGGWLRSLWALPPLTPRTLRTRRAPVAQRIERPPPKR